MSPNSTSSKPKSFGASAQLDVLFALLKPICRFAIRHSLKIQEIGEVCKKALIEVAVEEIHRSGEQVSVSRINVMTGIHRAMVDQMLNGELKDPLANNIVSRVIEQWQSDVRFRNAQGTPMVLQLEGMNSPFIKLIQSVSTDLNPYTILFELERLGVVAKSKKGIKLQKKIYLTKDKLEGYTFLAEDTSDLVSAVQENLEENPDQPNLHMKTEFNNISAEALHEIKHWMLTEGSAFHKRIRKYLAQFDADASGRKNSLGKRFRVALGSFSIAAPMPAASHDKKDKE